MRKYSPTCSAGLCRRIKEAESYTALQIMASRVLQKPVHREKKEEKRARAQNRCEMRKKAEFQIQSFVVVRLYKRWHRGRPDY